MTAKNLHCNSCNILITNVKGSTRFMCPECGKYEIIRCGQCKRLGAKYKCAECGFEGPN